MAAQAPEMAPARRRGMSSAGRAGSGDGASEVAVVAVEVGEEEGGAREEEEGSSLAGGGPPARRLAQRFWGFHINSVLPKIKLHLK